MMPLELITPPRVPIGEWVEAGIDWINTYLRFLLTFIRNVGDAINDGVTDVLLFLPAPFMILVFALIAWLIRSWRLAIGVLISFALIWSMGQWVTSMQTLALVAIATMTAIIIAVPLGILAAKNETASKIIRPVLDLMQTMPAMVYLIPAITFFSIGAVPALFSTIIFSLPPAVRLTELGIRQVDTETVEAGHSFGATEGEILRGIQLPLAVPSIMAGINQVIMLALSMVVLAGMVGAGGLGGAVVGGISSLDVPLAVEAGLAVVVVAIFLDRVTAALGKKTPIERAHKAAAA